MSVADGLLVILRDGPGHGYQLATEFADRTARRWSLNTGQVYTTLERLVRDGYVTPDEAEHRDRRRRSYRLTPQGRTRAGEWLAAQSQSGEARDDLVLRVMLAAAVDPAGALELIDRQRRHVIDQMRAARREQRAAGGGLIERLSADAAATRLEAEGRWLDLAEARLRALEPNGARP